MKVCPYPKIWGTGNPGVARGTQRHQGRPFQAHASPSAIARNKGAFSEIILTPEGGDGWFSVSTVEDPPTRIRGTPRPRQKFNKRGTMPGDQQLTRFSTGLAPSGNGWAYVAQFNSFAGNVYDYSLFKTTDGGRSASFLFDWLYAQPWESIGVSAYFESAYLGAPSFVTGMPLYFEEDVDRQKPCIRIFFLDEGDWFFTDIPMPTFTTNKDYTFSQVSMPAPGAFVFTTALPNDYPTLWVTYDYGVNWGGYVLDDTTVFVGVDLPVPGWATEAAAPGATTDIKRANFLGQQEIQDIAKMAHMSVNVLSLRRVLIQTVYPIDYAMGDYVAVETILDLTSGNIEWQSAQLPQDGDGTDFYQIHILGEDSWMRRYIEYAGPPAVPDQDFDGDSDNQVTIDAGATFTPISLQSEARWVGPIVGAHRPYEMTPIWAKVYYTVRAGGRREFWFSEDNFDTTEESTQIAPASAITYNYDYNTVTWVGMPGSPAPCDPCVPWRTDTRVTIPSWWYDGLPEP